MQVNYDQVIVSPAKKLLKALLTKEEKPKKKPNHGK